MTTRLTLSALAAVLGLTVAGSALADLRGTVEERRTANPPKVSVEACPMDDNEFWHHWATERGYEHILRGNTKEAAACYDKASQMYRKGIRDPSGDCGVCDTYTRFATILRELPSGAINLAEETFEESAKRALSSGDKPLASRLYELTAIGWSRMEIEGYYGRFQADAIIHRQSRPWQDGHLKAGEFFEVAARLAPNKTEKRRLLQDARDFTAGLLDTGHCYDGDAKDNVAGYTDCQRAKETVARLETTLKNSMR